MSTTQQNANAEPTIQTNVCIVGAGPAGLMAAICAAEAGASTVVLETNAGAGRKLLVTGGGRCNFTHDATVDDLVKAFGKAGRFLRHSFHTLSADDVRAFFNTEALESIVEPDGCVFPAVGRAEDVRDMLEHRAQQVGANLLYGARVTHIESCDSGFVAHAGRKTTETRSVVIATGGVSWPQTGSRGDGYRFAARLGHEIAPPKASLVPLIAREKWSGTLAGVSVANVSIRIADKPKVTAHGALLFTQDGVGGPAAQDLSRALVDMLGERRGGIEIRIDLLPGVNEADLDQKLRDLLAANPKKTVANILAELVPRRLASTLCALAKCREDTQAAHLPKAHRRALVGLLKGLPLCITATRSIDEATVTRGGVTTTEIEPRTMESRLCTGLYFAGEVIDADGPCGGYNLQMCFSTGALAGRSAARTGDLAG
jgi:predicted Rossmann fold flavoprotein